MDPSALPKEIFASIGRTVLRDIGATAIGMRLFVSLVPYNFLANSPRVSARTSNEKNADLSLTTLSGSF